MPSPTPETDPSFAEDSPVSWDQERTRLIRIARQRLESLARAGLDRLVIPSLASRPVARPVGAPAPVAVRPVTPEPARPAAATAAPTAAPVSAPTPRPAAPRPVAPPSRSPATVGSLFEEPKIGSNLPPEQRVAALAALAGEVAGCARCPHLAATRTQTVFGEGSATARLMFIGEAPGADEDASGRPFVGRAGALLTDMITKGMGLDRSSVYIANVLKSRPPENRTPLPDEIAHCLPYLQRQIELVQPEFLCLLGKTAASAILETALPLGKLRGKWHQYRGIATIVTYHPSALLRNPAWKKDAWADLQTLMLAMGVKPPERNRPG